MSQATNISVYVSLPFVFAFFLRFSRKRADERDGFTRREELVRKYAKKSAQGC